MAHYDQIRRSSRRRTNSNTRASKLQQEINSFLKLLPKISLVLHATMRLKQMFCAKTFANNVFKHFITIAHGLEIVWLVVTCKHISFVYICFEAVNFLALGGRR